MYKQPFPTAALSIVNWLQDFQGAGRAPLLLNEMAELSICPPPSVTPVPAVASVMGTRPGSTCAPEAR